MHNEHFGKLNMMKSQRDSQFSSSSYMFTLWLVLVTLHSILRQSHLRPMYRIFCNESAQKKLFLVLQFQQYALSSEVSSFLGSGHQRRGQTDNRQHTDIATELAQGKTIQFSKNILYKSLILTNLQLQCNWFKSSMMYNV